MFPYQMPPQYAGQNEPHLVDASLHLLARSAPNAQFTCHWICTGCGAAHTRMLPEECLSCGATALEFEYAPLSEAEIVS